MSDCKFISRDNVIASFSPHSIPAEYCDPGDVIVFECRNCYDDRLRADGSVFEPEKAIDNPATGPLYVKGADPGDVLAIKILDIKLKGRAYMRTSTSGGAFFHRVTERITREFDVSGDFVQFNEDISIPLRPMIGVIGTAPETGELSTEIPFDTGSNMDCKEIVAGSVLFLPVCVPGALLSIGDVHAVMGDGESMICGLEAAADVKVSVDILRGRNLPTPCLIHEGGKIFSTIQSAPDLMEASLKAANRMLDYIVEYTDIGEYDGGKLLSLVGNLEICHIINDNLTVRMEIERKYLGKADAQLNY